MFSLLSACLQVSLSLGCPGVFLFGGDSREDDSLALLLRSGDVLVMVHSSAGRVSHASCNQYHVQAGSARKCYHGVPRVLHMPHALSMPAMLSPSISTELPVLAGGGEGSEALEWHLIQKLLQDSRININIRQVEP
jgi:alkylated DNA repair protein alkB family protein 1